MFLKAFFFAALVAVSLPAFATDSGELSSESLASESTFDRYSYFRWGRSNDGYGRCYEYASSGGVLNQGMPVPSYHCERVSRSIYRWGRGNDGYTRCYHYTRSGLVLDEGRPSPNYLCR